MSQLWRWSLCVGSISVAVSGVATMWLPWPWDVIGWAVLAIALCTIGGRLYPVSESEASS